MLEKTLKVYPQAQQCSEKEVEDKPTPLFGIGSLREIYRVSVLNRGAADPATALGLS